MKNVSVTVGIATSFAGNNLLSTAKTIDLSIGNKPVKRVIYADNTPLTPGLKQELEEMKFKLHWTPGPGSFFQKVQILIRETTTDILILTQDDILFDKETVSSIVRTFQSHPDVTMVGIRILPLSAETAFENTMTAMVRLIDSLARLWNNGDNYLAASGRCLAFRTAFLKQIQIPEVVNGDVYLYLANAREHGKFFRDEQSKVYIRSPQRFADQIGPSSRYQYSQIEMEACFQTDLTKVYRIPKVAIVKAFFYEFFTHPFSIFGYGIVYILTRLMRKSAKEVMKTMWEADTSTKNVYSDHPSTRNA